MGMYVSLHISKTTNVVTKCCLWSWLGHTSAALLCVVLFRFCG